MISGADKRVAERYMKETMDINGCVNADVEGMNSAFINIRENVDDKFTLAVIDTSLKSLEEIKKLNNEVKSCLEWIKERARAA